MRRLPDLGAWVAMRWVSNGDGPTGRRTAEALGSWKPTSYQVRRPAEVWTLANPTAGPVAISYPLWIILGPRIHRWRAFVFSLTLPTTGASRCSQTSRSPWPCESTDDGVAHRFDPDPIRQQTPKTDAANPSARHHPGLS